MHPIKPKKNIKAVGLLSGGLDSTLAAKLILEQGIAVYAINFTSPFCTCTPKNQLEQITHLRLIVDDQQPLAIDLIHLSNFPLSTCRVAADHTICPRHPREGLWSTISTYAPIRYYCTNYAVLRYHNYRGTRTQSDSSFTYLGDECHEF